jgi:hypothetical protein
MRQAILLVVAAALLTAGCIITGNIVILIELDPFTIEPNGLFGYEEVNLLDYGEYRDHKDDLNSVDDIGFVCKIRNESGASATGKLWISNTSSSSFIPNDKILVLDGITVAAGQTRTIKLDESYDFLKNFEAAREAILREQFTVYWEVPNAFLVQVTDMVIVLTINGKP